MPAAGGGDDEVSELQRLFPTLAAGQAYALSPLPVDRATPIAIPVVDEQQQVDEHLNAADMPAQPEGQAPEREGKEPAASGAYGGDVEEKELQNMFPSTDWPKK